jgi:hypothetical protein
VNAGCGKEWQNHGINEVNEVMQRSDHARKVHVYGQEEK